MYTQCPECLSIYEISQEQLRQSRGNVQCGVCDTRFRAQVRLAASLKSPLFERPKPKSTASTSQRPPTQPASPTAPAPQRQTKPPARTAGPDSRPARPAPDSGPSNRAAPQPKPPQPPDPGSRKPTNRSSTPASTSKPARPSRDSSANDQQAELTDWALATIDAEAGMEPMIRGRDPAQESNNEAMPQVLDKSENRSGFWRILAIGLVTVAASLAVAQGAWLLRQPLAEVPVLGALIKPWCGTACTQQGSTQDMDLLQIADRRIHAHPRVEGVILVEVTIRNAGQTATAYPALRLRLLDDNQQLVAERTLLPDAYMRELRPGDRLSAGALLPLSVAVEAPRRSWSHYELELLASVVL